VTVPWLIGLVVLAAAIGLGLCWRWPRLPLRAFLWLVAHSIYWVRIYGLENVPATGGALLVCNHITFIDWLLLMAAEPRSIRFVVFAAYARHWLFRPFVYWSGAIPIDGSGGPKTIVQSLRAASEALNRGELVCIFAEGALTRTGFLLPFHRGFEQILKRSPAPIVPVCLNQLWGSIFSLEGGSAFWKWPRELPYPVTIAFGPAMPATTRAADVRLAIQKLSADCAIAENHQRLPVHRQFVRTAARHPLRSCIFDLNAQTKALNYGRVFAAAACFTRLLRPLLGPDPMVGVWLPPGAGGAITNIALAFLGKTAVNLNYTSSPALIQSAIKQCGLRHVITSHRFIQKMKLDPGPEVELIYAEDFRPKISRFALFRAYLAAILLPGFVLDRWVMRLGSHKLDDLATVVFSSGSTADPKGVMLTHCNIAANAVSMIQAIGVRRDDRLLGTLPFFHSFGYTVTLWVPLQIGASLVYYPDPRQAKEIGELCRQHRCSCFVTTPTFLRLCSRRCEPNDFRTVRALVCGAEKLPQSLAREFKEKFGVLPLEGYGCTELSPVATTNVPDVEVRGVRQVGNKPGTIGQPIPGVAARVVDPDTFATQPVGQEGLLCIYGANVMKGYLNRPEQTAQVIRDGWYVTGDMATIDEDGFITITGRLSRFAKIGGEMVPLQKIEEELHGILQTTEHVCAVTAVPDPKKGERVVVLHVPLNGMDVKQLSQQLATRGLPSLGLPGERDFYQIAEIPILGSGKLDLKRVYEIALEKVRCNGQ
jgi:acyl-[acyl-carrier-protein]-phospholipid O-acyltransferase/long-chain-fatty-acid--[acyl-carrier-protein] ligase